MKSVYSHLPDAEVRPVMRDVVRLSSALEVVPMDENSFLNGPKLVDFSGPAREYLPQEARRWVM